MTTTRLEEELMEELRDAGPEARIICVMNHTGDTRTMWDPRNKEEVALARAAFEKAREQRMVIYKVNPDSGEKAEIVQGDFDKKLGKMIIAKPQNRGG